MTNLKPGVDKLDIAKLGKVWGCLNNLESKVDDLDVDELARAPTYVYDELVKKVNDIDTSELVTKTDDNTIIKDIEDKVPSITGLATTTALNAIKNKIPNVTALVKKVD